MKRFVILSLLLLAFITGTAQQKPIMIRIAEIEVHEKQLEAYKEILQEEALASILKEPGVISIFPMFEKEHPTQFRLLEIYANREAYEAHLKTPHFLHYKSSTLSMVKSLRLVKMDAIDHKTMKQIFCKLND